MGRLNVVNISEGVLTTVVIPKEELNKYSEYIYVFEGYDSDTGDDIFKVVSSSYELSKSELQTYNKKFSNEGYDMYDNICLYRKPKKARKCSNLTISKIDVEILEDYYDDDFIEELSKYVYVFDCYSKKEGQFVYAMSYDEKQSKQDLLSDMKMIEEDEKCTISLDVELCIRDIPDVVIDEPLKKPKLQEYAKVV